MAARSAAMSAQSANADAISSINVDAPSTTDPAEPVRGAKPENVTTGKDQTQLIQPGDAIDQAMENEIANMRMQTIIDGWNSSNRSLDGSGANSKGIGGSDTGSNDTSTTDCNGNYS